MAEKGGDFYAKTAFLPLNPAGNLLRTNTPVMINEKQNSSFNSPLKKTLSRDFQNFLLLGPKTPPGPHMNRQKRFRENFSFCEDFRETRV